MIISVLFLHMSFDDDDDDDYHLANSVIMIITNGPREK